MTWDSKSARNEEQEAVTTEDVKPATKSPTVISGAAARALLKFCTLICCGVFVLEAVVYLNVVHGPVPVHDMLGKILEGRYDLLSLGRKNPVAYLAMGLLLHCGMATLITLALQRLLLRNRGLAILTGALIFLALEGCFVALAMGSL